MKKYFRGIAIAALSTTLTLVLSGCSTNGGGEVDAAGMTQEEVASLTSEARFDLFGDRYVRMQELMADAQLSLSTDPWRWGSKGLAANGGGAGQRWSMPGATYKNSYYLDTTRMIQLPGADGDKRDTEPMVEYFESQGWPATVDKTQTGSWEVRAGTDDGYGFEYVVQPNGWYALSLYSKVFWGDPAELSSAVIGRIPEEDFAIEGSPPGEYIPFPKWSDPLVTTPE